MPTLERALEEMESSGTGSTLGALGVGGCTSTPNHLQYAVLQSFFKGRLDHKDRPESTGAGAGKPLTGPRTLYGGAGVWYWLCESKQGFANGSGCRHRRSGTEDG